VEDTGKKLSQEFSPATLFWGVLGDHGAARGLGYGGVRRGFKGDSVGLVRMP